MSAILEIQNLSVRYETLSVSIEANRDVSFSIGENETIGLVGESGSGKTTLALALMGMLRAPGKIVGGSAMLGGTELAKLDAAYHAKLRLREIAYVPQGAMNSLNPVLRIWRSFQHAFESHGEHYTKQQCRSRVQELLNLVGLEPSVAERFPHELSGGMKQRVCIALAISLNPRLIIADEPTSALDVVTQRQVMEMLANARDRVNSSMILIGHDMALMAQSVDRVIVMRGGVVLEDAPVNEVFRAPKHAYTRQLIKSVPVLGGERMLSDSKAPAISTGPDLLELSKVSKVYGGGLLGTSVTHALRPIDLRISAGSAKIVAIVGQSGSGKSTLGSLVLGFAEPSTGEVRYQGRSLHRMPGQQRRDFRRQVQAVFQDPYATFNPFYRIERSLTLPLINFGIGSGREERRVLTEAACRQVGLDPVEVLDQFPHQLSGGQRQRLMVARSILLRPRLLVADEPVSMVDASLRATILDGIKELRDHFQITILYITHDLATAYRVSDFVMVLHQGRVVEAGEPDAVLSAPKHPYTRLLVNSIPQPDPEKKWTSVADQRELIAAVSEASRHHSTIEATVEGIFVRS